MTLHELLPEVLRLLGDIGCDHVTIARGDSLPVDGRSRACEARFTPDAEARSTSEKLPGGGLVSKLLAPDDRGELRLFQMRTWLGEQWSKWRTYESFDVADVLATDWRFLIRPRGYDAT